MAIAKLQTSKMLVFNGQEVKALVEAGKELNVKKGMVITWNEKKEVDKDGMMVRFIPLWEWLTAE